MSLVASARVVFLPVSFLGGACIYRLQKRAEEGKAYQRFLGVLEHPASVT